MSASKLRTRDSRLIEPRVRTESNGAREQSSSRLPDAVVSEQVQRLAVCTAVGAGLWTYGLVMDTIVRPLTVGVIVPRTNVTIEPSSEIDNWVTGTPSSFRNFVSGTGTNPGATAV